MGEKWEVRQQMLLGCLYRDRPRTVPNLGDREELIRINLMRSRGGKKGLRW